MKCNMIVNEREKLELLPEKYTFSDRDVICARGHVFAKLPGNLRFTEVIRKSVDCYRSAKSRRSKTRLIGLIVQRIMYEKEGLRFVKFHDRLKRWYVLDREGAHHKVGHAIRDYVRFCEKRSNQKKPGRSLKARRMQESNSFQDPSRHRTIYEVALKEILSMRKNIKSAEQKLGHSFASAEEMGGIILSNMKSNVTRASDVVTTSNEDHSRYGAKEMNKENRYKDRSTTLVQMPPSMNNGVQRGRRSTQSALTGEFPDHQYCYNPSFFF